MSAFVELRHVRVEYRAPRRRPVVAVNDVSLDIIRGRTVGLVGESGSGKSTLGNAMLGLVPVADGTITFDGEDITAGGQRQRIAIARAMTVEPEFLVCDEPVSALDLSVQAQVLNRLRDLTARRDLTTLFISHDLSVVRYLSDEIVVMFAGTVVERGPAGLVADAPRHPYSRSLVAAAPVPDPDEQERRRAQRRQFLTIGHEGNPPSEQGCPFVTRCPFAIDTCHRERPALEPYRQVMVACHRADEIPQGSDEVVRESV